MREYGAQVTIHNQLFDEKWIQGKRPADEVLLGNPDASSLIDLGGSFTVIRQMSLVPIDKLTLGTLALAPHCRWFQLCFMPHRPMSWSVRC